MSSVGKQVDIEIIKVAFTTIQKPTETTKLTTYTLNLK